MVIIRIYVIMFFPASSVVKLSPESFAQPENYLQDNETEIKVLTLQDIVADKSDAMQLFRVRIHVHV